MKERDILDRANKVAVAVSYGVSFYRACQWFGISVTRFRRFKNGDMKGVRIRGKLFEVAYTASGHMYFSSNNLE
jgi:hypothetical protein